MTPLPLTEISSGRGQVLRVRRVFWGKLSGTTPRSKTQTKELMSISLMELLAPILTVFSTISIWMRRNSTPKIPTWNGTVPVQSESSSTILLQKEVWSNMNTYWADLDWLCHFIMETGMTLCLTLTLLRIWRRWTRLSPIFSTFLNNLALHGLLISNIQDLIKFSEVLCLLNLRELLTRFPSQRGLKLWTISTRLWKDIKALLLLWIIN